MGCGASSSKVVPEDKRKVIAVFGATGQQGGAVVQELLTDSRFRVVAITRNPASDRAEKLRAQGVVVLEGDLDDTIGLKEIFPNVYGVFVISSYWDYMAQDREVSQGKNAVYCARLCGVKHFVYSGQPKGSDVIGKPCPALDSKATVEEYLRRQNGLTYTVIHVPFYYDNLLCLFPPHKLSSGDFAIPYPMGRTPLDGMALEDIGRCVHTIFRNPSKYTNRVIKLMSDSLKVREYAKVLTTHLAPRKFVDPKIRLKDFNRFNFKGSKELAAMFEFYQKRSDKRSNNATTKLCKNLLTFEQWVITNQAKLDRICQ